LAVGLVAPASLCSALCLPPTPAAVESCCHKETQPACHKQDGEKDCTCHIDAKSSPVVPSAPLAPAFPTLLAVILPERPDHAEIEFFEVEPTPILGTDSSPPGSGPPSPTASRAPPVIAA
jgi:hypothetical protein